MRIRALAIIAGLLHIVAPASSRAAEKPLRKFELQALSPKFWTLIDQEATLSQLATGFGFTEGPVWDRAGFLYVSDEEQNEDERGAALWAGDGAHFNPPNKMPSRATSSPSW